MITWTPTAEPFCRYARRRRADRRQMIADAYRRATDPTSRKLADRLAEPWTGVLIATIEEAQAGDAAALEALLILAPDTVLQDFRSFRRLKKGLCRGNGARSRSIAGSGGGWCADKPTG